MPETKRPPKGKLITFEGIDFSGKTLQSRLLHERLKDYNLIALLLRDPGATPISERIREILLNKANLEMSSWTELLLFEAARAQMTEETIKPAINQGQWVICDRFYDSTTAYQGYGRNLNLELVALANKIGACGLIPDFTILIDMKPEIAFNRQLTFGKEFDRLEEEGHDFQRRVRQGYLQIAKNEPKRMHVINGDQSVDRIQNEIWQVFTNKFQRQVDF